MFACSHDMSAANCCGPVILISRSSNCRGVAVTVLDIPPDQLIERQLRPQHEHMAVQLDPALSLESRQRRLLVVGRAVDLKPSCLLDQ